MTFRSVLNDDQFLFLTSINKSVEINAFFIKQLRCFKCVVFILNLLNVSLLHLTCLMLSVNLKKKCMFLSVGTFKIFSMYLQHTSYLTHWSWCVYRLWLCLGIFENNMNTSVRKIRKLQFYHYQGQAIYIAPYVPSRCHLCELKVHGYVDIL